MPYANAEAMNGFLARLGEIVPTAQEDDSLTESDDDEVEEDEEDADAEEEWQVRSFSAVNSPSVP